VKANLTYSERVSLAHHDITLDGQPARIVDPTSSRAVIVADHGRVARSWLSAKRTIKNGGRFLTQPPNPPAPPEHTA
jgi:hypothetical protein